LVYEKHPASINEIVSFMNRVALSPETKLKRDNFLMVVNGVDSSVLNADELMVQDGDVVTVVPVVHGG
jgi:molybdopterin converting factor small subunit